MFDSLEYVDAWRVSTALTNIFTTPHKLHNLCNFQKLLLPKKSPIPLTNKKIMFDCR